MPEIAAFCLSESLNFGLAFPPFFHCGAYTTLAERAQRYEGNETLRYLIEECLLDTDYRELRQATDLVAIDPQAFDLLVYLVQHCDRVVGKDDPWVSLTWARHCRVGIVQPDQCGEERNRRHWRTARAGQDASARRFGVCRRRSRRGI